MKRAFAIFGLMGVLMGSGCTVACAGEHLVYFNGSSDAERYYQGFRSAIQEIRESVFDRRGVYLDSTGPNARFSPDDEATGLTQRDAQGRLISKPVDLGFGTIPATRQRLENAYATIAADQACSSALLYIGDHGSQEGAVTSDGEIATGGFFREQEAKIPASCTVRRIHMHCFSGAALVDPQRFLFSLQRRGETPPVSSPEFLDHAYPANRCGFALSREDEFGFVIQNQKDLVAEGFRKNRSLSLQDLKTLARGREGLGMTPMVTSDYLMEDVIFSFCTRSQIVPDRVRRHEPPPRFVEGCPREPEPVLQVKAIDPIRAQLVKEACAFRDQFELEIKKIDSVLRDEQALNYQLSVVRSEVALELFKTADPESYEILVSARAKGSRPPEKVNEKWAKFKEDPKVSDRMERLDRDWIRSRKVSFPLVAELVEEAGETKVNLDLVRKRNTRRGMRLQEERRKALEGLQVEKARLFQSLLEIPDHQEVKKRYLNLTECEKGPIRAGR